MGKTQHDHRRIAEGKEIKNRFVRSSHVEKDFKPREVEYENPAPKRKPNLPYSSKKNGRGFSLPPQELTSLMELLYDHIDRSKYTNTCAKDVIAWYKVRYSPARHSPSYNPLYGGLCVEPHKLKRDFEKYFITPPGNLASSTSARHKYTSSVRDVVVVKGKDVVGGCNSQLVAEFSALSLTGSLPRKEKRNYPKLSEVDRSSIIARAVGDEHGLNQAYSILPLKPAGNHKVKSQLNGNQGEATNADDVILSVYHKTVKYNVYETFVRGICYYYVEDAGELVGIIFSRDDTFLSTEEEGLPCDSRYWRGSATDIRWMCNLVLWKVLTINGNNGSWTNTDDLSAMLNINKKQKIRPAPGCGMIRPLKPSKRLDPAHHASRIQKILDEAKLKKEDDDFQAALDWEKKCDEQFNKVEYLLNVHKGPLKSQYVSEIIHVAAGGAPGEDLKRNNRLYDPQYQKMLPEMLERLAKRKPRSEPRNADDWRRRNTKVQHGSPSSQLPKKTSLPSLAARKQNYENVKGRIFGSIRKPVLASEQKTVVNHHPKDMKPGGVIVLPKSNASVLEIPPPQLPSPVLPNDDSSTISSLSSGSITVDTNGVPKKRKRKVSGNFARARKAKNLFNKLPRNESFILDSPPKIEAPTDNFRAQESPAQHCGWDLETEGFEDSICNSIMNNVKVVVPSAPPLPIPIPEIYDDFDYWKDVPDLPASPMKPDSDSDFWNDSLSCIAGEEGWVERPNKPCVICCPPQSQPDPKKYVPEPKRYVIGNLEYFGPLLKGLYGSDSKEFSKPYGERRTWMKFFQMEQSTLDHLGVSSYSDYVADSKMIKWMMREFISSKLLNSTRLLENWLAESTRQFPNATPEELNLAVVITYQQLTHLKRVRDMLLGPSALISSRVSF